MAKSTVSPHDKFFRSVMAHKTVAIDFFQHHLPEPVFQALNPESLTLLPQGQIDPVLQEHFSDLVFQCQLADHPAYITLLVEHQSSPDKDLPFRVFHYLFGVLQNHRKTHPNTPLPATFPLVFYHGDPSPYPYPLSLEACFDDPLGVMKYVLTEPIPLVDVHQLSDQQLKQYRWVGPMARALKHIREQDISVAALDILSSLTWPLTEDNNEARELLQILLYYLLTVGNIDDVEAFMTASREQLSTPMRGELMTAAEQLLQKGRLEGQQKGRQEGRQKAD